MTGTGTATDPYIISTLADLQAMEDDLTAYYELGGNIDASGSTAYDGGAGFVPIGQAGYFTGQLDGKGYTISDLFINRADNYQALFYNIDTGAVIQNVKMTLVDITGTGGAAIGALVGYMLAGTVTSCSSTGTTDGDDMVGGLIGEIVTGVVSKSWSSCVATATDDYAGGFAGYIIGGAISKCYATGNVVAADDYAGGFVGGIQAGAATIDDCYARGNATASGATAYGVGGFVGYNGGAVIDDCYSTGIATGTAAYTGGFCGVNGDTITNCFWDTETSGNATSDGGTGKTTAQMKTQATFTDAGWDFTTPIWYITSGVNSGYPSLNPSVAGEVKGEIIVKGTRFQYFDYFGVQRYVEGLVVE